MIRYIVPENATLLFVGINPHPGSYLRGVPFSNNKTFWYNLADAGFIDKDRIYLKDDRKLKHFYLYEFSKKFGYGFINLVDRPTINTSGLKRGEEEYGVKRLNKAIKIKKPVVICFIGKITYSRYTGNSNFKLGVQKETIYDSKVFVLSFPIRGPRSIRIGELLELKRYLDGLSSEKAFNYAFQFANSEDGTYR
ncbi:MAG: uracil-DNA glycosylase family protein [Thermoplasmata archaeon]